MKASLPVALLFATFAASNAIPATPETEAALNLPQSGLLNLPLLPTQDDTLTVTLLPNTPYLVTATVSTNNVNALLALLQNGQSPLQILDQAGHLLGELSAQDLIDALTGLTGAVTRDISVPLDQVLNPVSDLVVRTINTPLLSVSRASSSRDHRPRVIIRRTIQRDSKLIIRGRATDDGKVQRVEVTFRGHLRIAKGTSARWHANVPLKKGKNRIRIRAIDNASQMSPAKRLTATR